MKIVFDHQIFYLQQYGGISRYFCELSSRLHKNKNFDISVIAPFHINQYLRANSHQGVRNNYFPTGFRGAGRIQRAGRRILLPLFHAINADADVIHETYYSLNPTGRARCRVVTVYDMIHEFFADDFKDDSFTTKAKRAAVARADHVICISESTRQDLIRLFGVDARKTTVVHLGYSLATNTSSVLPAKLASGRPYFLYVGNRSSYKNFLRLCESFSQSVMLRKDFDIVSFGGGGLTGDEKIQLISLGIMGNVHHMSGDDALLASYYMGAAAFVYPSLYEGFGIPPLEAMGLGCPVACSNISSIPEVVGNAGTYFEPDCVNSMRDTLENLVQDSSLRSQLISKGYARLNQFSWDKCASETARVYESVS